MSARDELLREMTHNHLYMTDEQATDLVDAFAHELADRIRLAGGWTQAATEHLRGMGAAADLIDPAVSGRAPEGSTT